MPEKQNAKGVSGIADKPIASQRDMTLVNILDRMVGQMHKHDALLQDVIDNQTTISGDIENSVFHQSLNRDELDAGIKRLYDSFSRYRADMLSFVREQDIMRNSVEDMAKQVTKLAYSFEDASKVIADIDTRLKHQEKIVHDHIEYSNRKWEKLPQDLSETNRSVAELHTDFEKHLGKTYGEIHKQLDRYQKETTRRLLTLDGMMSALETLLIRTEPPEIKQSKLKRVICGIGKIAMKVGRFFRKIGKKIIKILLHPLP